MLIVADENIPLLDEFFAGFGEIRRLPGRAIDPAAVRAADALLVRSVTPVSRELLAQSKVGFVGTCTIGTDHLDIAHLTAAGITWASAPGCNARGVVDYVLGSILALAEQQGVDLASRTYGVVGAGQVGSRLVAVLRGLGWHVRVCDPPRQALEGGDYVSLAQILDDCDVISLHTPLDQQTRHLIDRSALARLRNGCWLINASRGAVVDNLALLEVLRERADLQVVLDVWEGEPLVNAELAALCRLATPHIAGYSLDGKLRGTAQIYQAFCAWQQVSPALDLQALMPRQWLQEISLDPATPPAVALPLLCRAVYDPRRDDADFRRSLLAAPEQRRTAFDQLRKAYPLRREIDGLKVRLPAADPALVAAVRALGCERV